MQEQESETGPDASLASYGAVVLSHPSGQGVIVPLYTLWAGIKTAADWQRMAESFEMSDYEGFVPPQLRTHLLFSAGGPGGFYELSGKTVEKPADPLQLVEVGEMQDWFSGDRVDLLVERVFHDGQNVAEILSGQDAEFETLFFWGLHPQLFPTSIEFSGYSVFWGDYPTEKLHEIHTAEFNLASSEVWARLNIR